VAKEVYGINPMEVEPKKLLDTEGMRLEEDVRDMQKVIYGSRV
jgi:hypothetical protein